MRIKLYNRQGEWPGLLNKDAVANRLEQLAKGIRNGTVAPEEAAESMFASREESALQEFRFTYYEQDPS